MLLRALTRRRPVPDAESGNALAGVIGILAVTGTIAATLLTVTVYGTGFTGASRAAVEAQAAAEGGIHYAAANLAACDASTRTISRLTGAPRFTVTVEYRMAPFGEAWLGDTCPPPQATGIRLRSTGFAESTGVAGHSRGDRRTVEAVLAPEFPFVLPGDRAITVNGGITVDTSATAAVTTNGTLDCSFVQPFPAMIFVGGSGCDGVSGVVRPPAFDPSAPPHLFPRLTVDDQRWPRARSVGLSAGSCTVGRSGSTTTSLTLTRGLVQCNDPLVLTNVVIELTGDVVVFAQTIDASDLVVRAAAGAKHSLYLVKPWGSGQAACSATSPRDVTVRKLKTENATRVMIYSSTGVALVPPTQVAYAGQIYACHIHAQGSTKVTYAPTGPLRIHSLRDVTA